MIYAIIVNPQECDQAILIQAETKKQLEEKIEDYLENLLIEQYIDPEEGESIEDKAMAYFEEMQIFRSPQGQIEVV